MIKRMRMLPWALLVSCPLLAAPAGDFHTWAPTPPMGWNSWDNFGTTITEAQTKQQAECENNRQLFRTDDGLIAWVADVPQSRDKYLALFNTRETPAQIPVKTADLGVNGAARLRDLWNGKDLGPAGPDFAPEVAPHGARLIRVKAPL